MTSLTSAAPLDVLHGTSKPRPKRDVDPKSCDFNARAARNGPQAVGQARYNASKRRAVLQQWSRCQHGRHQVWALRGEQCACSRAALCSAGAW